MALPASGELKVSDIAAEFNDTAPYQMSEYYRGAGKVPDSAGNAAVPASGQIGMGNFYNAANRAAVALSISSSTQNYDVYTQASASPAYVAGTSDITLTVNPGVAVGSSSTGTYALSVPNSFNPGDSVTIVNNGTVIGRGGDGGRGYTISGVTYIPSTAGTSGGNAVYVNFPTTITNNGTIAGGGGGGGGGGGVGYGSKGGGGGGGAGSPGGSGGPGVYGNGASGTLTAGGGGGAGGPSSHQNPYFKPPGGAGGGQGANGSAGANGRPPTQYSMPGSPGGTRGFYLVGNPITTFPATGTLLGQVS